MRRASGHGSHHAARGEKPQKLPLTQHSLLQTPLLTQGSLADVCAGGSSNNELGVSADLLETNAQSMVSTVGWPEPWFPVGASSPSSIC